MWGALSDVGLAVALGLVASGQAGHVDAPLVVSLQAGEEATPAGPRNRRSPTAPTLT
ncbi:hypothetical protein [Stigmatella aurantiaca]|uniref:hypothetical protein n=1 Tax=Stigmatella aurantiaca TaxID=41 RepID=UPI00030AAF03|nr:hypothetical protein [Stigmatella aurantiaca]